MKSPLNHSIVKLRLSVCLVACTAFACSDAQTGKVGASATVGGTHASGSSASGGATAAGGSGSGTAGKASTGGASANGGAASGAGGTTGTTTGPASHTNPLSQSLIDQFVTAHNNARSGTLNPAPNPALPPVTWDYALADSAYNYLSQCPGGSVSLAPHNANRTTDYAALGGTVYVGENIYASTGSATPQAAVNSWMSEASSYNYTTNNISAAGHYTQVVWRTSVRIGCAIVSCSNYTYKSTILCDYAPGGNNANQKPY